MKAILLALTLITLQQSDCDPVEQRASGYTVRLCSERDLLTEEEAK